MDIYHLTKHQDNYWQLKKEGASKATILGTSKKEIVKKSHAFLESKTATLKIYGDDGSVLDEKTFASIDQPQKLQI